MIQKIMRPCFPGMFYMLQYEICVKSESEHFITHFKVNHLKKDQMRDDPVSFLFCRFSQKGKSKPIKTSPVCGLLHLSVNNNQGNILF